MHFFLHEHLKRWISLLLSCRVTKVQNYVRVPSVIHNDVESLGLVMLRRSHAQEFVQGVATAGQMTAFPLVWV